MINDLTVPLTDPPIDSTVVGVLLCVWALGVIFLWIGMNQTE